MHISALTDHEFTPSSRFRVRQLIPSLCCNGINIIDFPRKYSTELTKNILPNKRIRENPIKLLSALRLEALNLAETFTRIRKSQNDFKYSWISRELMIGYPSFECLIKNKYIYDIDDALFLRNNYLKKGIDRLINNANIVFSGNKYLYEYCIQYNANVVIIPTSVDTERFTQILKKDKHDFIIGWSGTSSSFSYLKNIEVTLYNFFKKHKNAKLKICSDKYPWQLNLLYEYIEYEKWTQEDEVNQIQSFDVGIMPLQKNEWTKGKCAYKMLLYASCGIPTVTTSYGMNEEVLELGKIGIGCHSDDEWFDALNHLYKNKDYLSENYNECRKIIEKYYSIKEVTIKVLEQFNKLRLND